MRATKSGQECVLSDLAAETHQSAFHAHRMLREVLGETPKHYTLRLRVDRAAAALVSSGRSILEIALDLSDSRAMRHFVALSGRRFHMSPSAYRKRGSTWDPDARAHADMVDQIGPCVGCTISTREKGK